ncbi:hypothetical protein RHSIM_Rhsim07G0175700 [Rhododendron simsii]|uniref:Myelin-associated oligodendrocyte basic protein n=1 Tax=Rhododendron simsii TaxID=118357 RepID=A0A834GSG1_RHOSS|nr:hypothetical protein RHSIM_Rhsim07G0175700 [Rhododendron simsii]
MATTPFLLQTNTIKCTPPLLHPYPIRPSSPPLQPSKIPAKFRTTASSKLTVKCSFLFPANNSDVSNKTSSSIQLFSDKQRATANNHFEIVSNSILKALKALRKPAVAAVLVGLLLMYDPVNSALAASGGRMGGKSFSSSRSSSSSSSSSSRSYTTREAGPRRGFSDSFSYYAPSPFGFSGGGGGFYLGPAVGFGVGAGSSFLFVLAGFAAFILVSGFLSDQSEGSVLTATENTSVLKLQFYLPPKQTLRNMYLKLKVGLLGMGRSLQRDLNKIAESADTSTTEGLSYVLTETTLALLRHPDYCISGYSSFLTIYFLFYALSAFLARPYLNFGEEGFFEIVRVEVGLLLGFDCDGVFGVDVKRSIDEGEKRFNQLSIEERGKFDEETLVNVNNIKRKSTTNQRASGFSNEYIVITILVAAQGVHKLPAVNGSRDLKEALQKLASIPASRTLAVEVLWTPQNENDTLSERELLEDYPLLRPL